MFRVGDVHQTWLKKQMMKWKSVFFLYLNTTCVDKSSTQSLCFADHTRIHCFLYTDILQLFSIIIALQFSQKAFD